MLYKDRFILLLMIFTGIASVQAAPPVESIIPRSVINLVLVIAAFQYFLLFSFLLLQNKGKTISNRLFAAFLFAKAIGILDWLFYRYHDFFSGLSPVFFKIGEPFIFLLAPLLYLYIQSLVYKDFKLQLKDGIHLLPFLIYQGVFTICFYTHSPEFQRSVRSVFGENGMMIYSGAIVVQLVLYFILSLILLQDYQKQLKQQYASLDKLNLSWLKSLLYVYILVNMPYLLKHFLFIFIQYYYSGLIVLTYFGNMVFSILLLYKGLQYSQLFNGIEQSPKYGRGLLPEKQRQDYLKQIQTFMNKEKPFLDPELSLQDLAEKVNIPAHHVSQVLNDCLNQNFFDFVNAYRIEACKKRFSKRDNGKETVLEVMYDAGFNSKSTFNAVFKKQVGMTPTQFIRSTF